jgi:hypothetical protein
MSKFMGIFCTKIVGTVNSRFKGEHGLDFSENRRDTIMAECKVLLLADRSLKVLRIMTCSCRWLQNLISVDI